MPMSAPAPTVLFTHRFAEDFRGVSQDVARRTARRVALILEHGVRYSGLETRRIQGQRDPGYHYVDVDNAYRMVVYLQGNDILLEKLGPHDPTLRWGAHASIAKYVQRARATVRDLPELQAWLELERVESAQPAATVEVPPDLLQTLADAPGASDLVVRAQPDFLEGYRDGLLEDWMVFLSPLQRYIVTRGASGPVRLSGGPGTGKTVAALHRTAYLAQTLGPGARILLTSYVRTLPPILKSLFARLTADVPDEHDGRVEFRHIVDIAKDVVARLDNAAPRLDNEKAKSLFDEAWQRCAARLPLVAHGFGRDYVWDEVGKVILGRLVRRPEDYATLARHGRRRAMSPNDRLAVWSILVAYGAACTRATPRVYDQDSLVLRAADLLHRSPTSAEYDAIIVDEAQDLTQAALSMLVSLVKSGPKGLLFLTGDGGQRIYPGGYRLSSLGVEVRGRSFVLRDAYRSSSGILDSIGRLGRLLSPDDFGESGLGSVDLRAVRVGNPPTIRRFSSEQEEAARIAGLLAKRPGDRVDATAVLLPTNSQARAWRQRLREHGIRTVLLEQYDGTPMPGVKVGTYARSKGLEFVTVFLPDVAEEVFPSVPLSRMDEYLLQGAWLYIAMARARDELIISYVGRPSYLIEEMVHRSKEGPLYAPEVVAPWSAPISLRQLGTRGGGSLGLDPDWRDE